MGENQFLGRGISQKSIDINYNLYLLDRANRENPFGENMLKTISYMNKKF